LRYATLAIAERHQRRVELSGRQARTATGGILAYLSLGAAFLNGNPIRPLADEAVRPLPGDELVADAKVRWNHAVTIRARPAEIWPWLVQMGCQRAG
jgi:hypothetical protein